MPSLQLPNQLNRLQGHGNYGQRNKQQLFHKLLMTS